MRVLNPDDPAEVLEAAADALEVYGRTHKTGVDRNGRLCVLGAIAVALGEHPQQWTDDEVALCPAARALADHLLATDALRDFDSWELKTAKEDGGRPAPWVWNDHYSRPEHDALIIDTLRRCAKDIRNGEAG